MALSLALMLSVLASQPSAELREALALEKQGQVYRAQVKLETLVFAYPTWELARLELARLLLVSGKKPEAARAHLDIARRVAPNNPRLHYLYGLFLIETGEEKAACASIEKALELRDSFQEARFRLAGLYAALEDWKAAEKHYRRYLKDDPDSKGARLQLAVVLERVGEWGHAEKEYLRLLREEPDSGVFQSRLLDFYVQTGQKKKARKLESKMSSQKGKRPLKRSAR